MDPTGSGDAALAGCAAGLGPQGLGASGIGSIELFGTNPDEEALVQRPQCRNMHQHLGPFRGAIDSCRHLPLRGPPAIQELPHHGHGGLLGRCDRKCVRRGRKLPLPRPSSRVGSPDVTSSNEVLIGYPGLEEAQVGRRACSRRRRRESRRPFLDPERQSSTSRDMGGFVPKHEPAATGRPRGCVPIQSESAGRARACHDAASSRSGSLPMSCQWDARRPGACPASQPAFENVGMNR